MTEHSQNRGTGLYRALRAVPAHEVDVRADRIIDHRDMTKESEASLLYEHLRLLSGGELEARAGVRDGRQQMIAEIIDREVYGG